MYLELILDDNLAFNFQGHFSLLRQQLGMLFKQLAIRTDFGFT